MRPLLPALVALGLALLPVRSLRADPPPADASAETAAPAEPPSAANLDGGATELQLSLRQALAMGMEGNLALGATRYEAPRAHAAWEAADASFDTLLTAGFDVAHTEEPASLSIFGASVIRTDTQSGSVGAQRMLRGGGRVALLYRADRIDTDSPFAALSPYWTPGLSVELTQPLLRGAGDVALADVRRAQNLNVAARAGYVAATEDTLLAIVGAYWELAFAEANLVARRKSETVASELFADEQARLEAEVATPLDVAEARAGVERRRSERFASENLRGATQDALLALILPFGSARLHARNVVQTDALSALPAGVPDAAQAEQLIALALRGRPELTISRAEIANRGLDTTVAHNALRPQLDLHASASSDALGRGGDAHENLLTGDALSGAIGLEFSIFIGQRAAKARWRAAGWARRQAELRHRDLENQIVVEVRGALRDVLTANAQIRAGESEVEAAQADLTGEQLKREQGKSTPFQVLQKEEDHTQAVARLARSRADLHVSMARLWRAVGNLTQAVGVAAPQWPACAPCR